MKILIVGGGIAGLSAAVALRCAGIEPLVCERASALGEVGAGITLWANAMRALDHIGVGEAVRSCANRVAAAELRRDTGRLLLRIPYSRFEAARALPPTLWILHRADLIGAISRHLPADHMRFGRTLVGVEQTPGEVTAQFADGSRESGDALIGADGVQSRVRESVWGGSPSRYAGCTCWRGIAPISTTAHPDDLLVEIWGRGLRMGISPLPGGRVFWFAVADAPAGGVDSDAKMWLLGRFAAWASPVPDIFRATPSNAIIRNDIIDRPPLRPWSQGRVLLIGDAAHSTTPNLGQGGCMAIEDAPVLARCLKRQRSIPEAFRLFEDIRYSRTKRVTVDSWRLGKLAQGSSVMVGFARDWLTRLTPTRLAFGQMASLTQYDTGAINS